MCAKCSTRPGTEIWTGDGGAIGWVHGIYAMWCKVCVLSEQLAHARKMADRVTALEDELRALTAGEAL